MSSSSERAPTLRWRIEWHDAVTSTMELARDAARGDAPAGLVVAAREQSAGRGRAGRDWVSPRGGLYASVLLRDPVRETSSLLPLAAGLAVCTALERFAPGLDLALKWPNDVVARRAPGAGYEKLAGVLTEASTRGASLAWVVIGFGVNLAIAPDDLPAAADLATADLVAVSLTTLGHGAPAPETALDAVLRSFGDILSVHGTDAPGLAAAATARLAYRDAEVYAVLQDGDEVRGTALRIAPTGHLVVAARGAEVAVAPWDLARLRAA